MLGHTQTIPRVGRRTPNPCEHVAVPQSDDDQSEPDLLDDEVDIDEVPETIETDLGEGQLAYDCTAWAGETRAMLTSLLAAAEVAHAWQGTTLTVHEADEVAVDDLIDEVLAAATPALDPDSPKVVYEVGQWPVALQTELAEGLTASDVPYERDERGDLVVRAEDEETVAAVLDDLPEPDEAEVSADDGVALHELFDSVFMATSRLVKHPNDPAATVTLVDTADLLAQVALPFGFEPAQWRRLVGAVSDLAQVIDPQSADDDADDEDMAPDTEDAEISQQALIVRDQIRQYI